MYGYKVRINHECTLDEYDGKEYGAWRKCFTNSFGGIYVEKSYPDLVSSEEFKNGDTVHVVWVEWSHGDSFGSAERGSVEALGVFSDYEDAAGLAKHIRKRYEDRDSEYDFTTSKGETIKSSYSPWTGYFETLEGIYVETVSMGAGRKGSF